MKSLVVISQKDFDYLSSKILSSQSHSQEPENQKSLKDHFIEELSSCTGVSRKFIKNSIKPRANDSVLMMISDYIDAAEKKQPPEEDEEEKEEIEESKEEQKTDVKKYELGISLEDSLNKIQEIKDDSFFHEALEAFRDHKIKEVSSHEKVLHDADIFSHINGFNKNDFSTVLVETLHINCSLICQKIIGEIAENNIDQILSKILGNSTSKNMFLIYLTKSLDKNNEEEFIGLIKRLFELSREQECFNEFIDLIYEYVIIKSLVKNLNSKVKFKISNLYSLDEQVD